MRWEGLFGDLEAQLSAADAAELASEVADRTRHEMGRLRLIDRLRPAVGSALTVHVLGGGVIHGGLSACGPDWLLLADTGREVLIAVHAVAGVSDLLPFSASPGSEGVVAAALTLRHALRGIARDRAPVAVTTVDGGALTGTIDRVGADFFEIAEHDAGEPRRPSNVRAVRTVPFAALAAVRWVAPG